MLLALKGHISRSFGLTGVTQGEAEARAVSVVALETEIAELMIPAADMRDPVALYNPHTLSQLQSLAPSFEWHGYLSAIGLLPATADEVAVIISSPQYMQGVLALVSATEAQVVSDYLQWHALAASLKLLSSQFREEESIFVSAVYG